MRKTICSLFFKYFFRIYFVGIICYGMVCLGLNQYHISNIEKVRSSSDTETLYKAIQTVQHPTYEIRIPDIATYENVSLENEYDGEYYLNDKLDVEDDVTLADVKYFYNTLQYLPNNVRNYLVDNDWTFVLTHDVIAVEDTSKVEKAAGLCYCADKKIEISTKYMREQGVICHEIGHALYYAGLKEYLDEIPTDVLNEELDNIYMYDAHGMIYLYFIQEEQLAQLFNDYCFHSESFKAQAPTVYSAFEKAISTL